MTVESDLLLGRQIIRMLVDCDLRPPLVKREYQSLARLHAELKLHGLNLVERRRDGPEAGYMLFYLKGNILVRIKTRGSRGKYRGGVPHLSVCVLSGNRNVDGSLDTSFDAEVGKFDVRGNLVSKKLPSNPEYNVKLSPLGKANAETWSDETHFDFPDLVVEDQCVESLWIDRYRSMNLGNSAFLS